MNLTEELSRPFDKRFVETVRKGSRTEDYVNHALVTQRLNTVLGVGEWSFRIVEVPSYTDPNGAPHVLHVLGEISLSGGIPTVRQEIGVPSRVSSYHDEVKAAVSDALKRCAMRLGVAIQLWHEVESSEGASAPAPALSEQASPAPTDSGASGDSLPPAGNVGAGGNPSDGESGSGDGEDPDSAPPFDAIDKLEETAPSFDAIAAMLGGSLTKARKILNDVNGTDYNAKTVYGATAFERKLAVAAINEGVE